MITFLIWWFVGILFSLIIAKLMGIVDKMKEMKEGTTKVTDLSLFFMFLVIWPILLAMMMKDLFILIFKRRQ